MGGTDDPKNLLKVNIPLHAFLHKILYEEHNFKEDLIAYQALTKQITKAEAFLGKILTNETKQKISNSMRNRKNLGV